jgi:hypothetical protein
MLNDKRGTITLSWFPFFLSDSFMAKKPFRDCF